MPRGNPGIPRKTDPLEVVVRVKALYAGGKTQAEIAVLMGWSLKKVQGVFRCGTTTAKAFDWANLTGNYGDVMDYAPMCRSCHWRYDGRVNNLRR